MYGVVRLCTNFLSKIITFASPLVLSFFWFCLPHSNPSRKILCYFCPPFSIENNLPKSWLLYPFPQNTLYFCAPNSKYSTYFEMRKNKPYSYILNNRSKIEKKKRKLRNNLYFVPQQYLCLKYKNSRSPYWKS